MKKIKSQVQTRPLFLQALRDLGWVEGKNIAIDYRWAARKRDRYPAMTGELVRLKVDLIDDYPPCTCRLLDGQGFEVQRVYARNRILPKRC